MHVLLEKHAISFWGSDLTEIYSALSEADHFSIESLINELVGTKGDLRNRVTPRYRFDERWDDFEKCLLLDGYGFADGCVVSLEPLIGSAEPMEDELSKELRLSSLPSAENVIQHTNLSADAFRKSNPDYNGCLSHSRIALETLVREVASQMEFNIQVKTKVWGKALNHLEKQGFVNKDEEAAIASSYTFISEGSHVPVGFTEKEFARFGRNLATSVCYYIVKKFNGQ